MLRTPRALFSTFAATRVVLFAIGVFAVSRMPINAVERLGHHNLMCFWRHGRVTTPVGMCPSPKTDIVGRSDRTGTCGPVFSPSFRRS